MLTLYVKFSTTVSLKLHVSAVFTSRYKDNNYVKLRIETHLHPNHIQLVF